MNFTDTEFIHYNDRLFKNPHPLCSALSVFRDGMKGRKRKLIIFFKINSQLTIYQWIILSPEDLIITRFFFFSNYGRYSSEQTVIGMYGRTWLSRQTHMSEIKQLQHIQGYSLLPFLLILNHSGAFSSVAMVTLYLAASSVVSY